MQQAKALLQMVKEKHYSPRAITDTLSEFLYERFFESIDPDRIFFTQLDIKGFDGYRKTLDDELNGNSWTFLNKIIPLYRLRLMQADTIINEITAKAFDFSANEFFSEKADTSWPENEKDKKSKWYQVLKLETLNGLADNALVQYNQSKNIDKKEILSKETQVRLMIKSRHQRYIKSILQSAESI